MIYDMGKRMNWIYKKLFVWFQRKCEHPPNAVVADILEGDASGTSNRGVVYCRACGAYKISYPVNGTAQQMWRLPHADWY